MQLGPKELLWFGVASTLGSEPETRGLVDGVHHRDLGQQVSDGRQRVSPPSTDRPATKPSGIGTASPIHLAS